MAKLGQLVESRENQDGDAANVQRQIDAIIYRTCGITDTEQTAIAEWRARSG